MTKPRGIRNNNPLNIRENHFVDFNWVGEAAEDWDKSFEEFDHPVWGYRAAAKILLNYQSKHNCLNIQQIILRWAPPVENDTTAYISSIIRQLEAMGLGTAMNDRIDLAKQRGLLRGLLRAMTVHENGECPYDDELIKAGICLAFSTWSQ